MKINEWKEKKEIHVEIVDTCAFPSLLLTPTAALSLLYRHLWSSWSYALFKAAPQNGVSGSKVPSARRYRPNYPSFTAVTPALILLSSRPLFFFQPGCKHYRRRCALICVTCSKPYVCRFCHDEVEFKHELDRKAVVQVQCLECKRIQPVAKNCVQCQVSEVLRLLVGKGVSAALVKDWQM